MIRLSNLFVLITLSLALSIAQIALEKQQKILTGFVDYLNNLPNQDYTYDDGVILKVQDLENTTTYYVEIQVKATDLHNLDNSKYLKCSSTINDLENSGINIQNNEHHCVDAKYTPTDTTSSGVEAAIAPSHTTEEQTQENTNGNAAISLENEIELNTGTTSGEQFIAVPRRQQGALCAGCASHINPDAPGVQGLADLALKHLDKHDPNNSHSIIAIIDVERQVQIVNGVRYTLILNINYNNCSYNYQNASCTDLKTCKISILEKSWIKNSDGSKYRAIVSNNCTQEWIFEDNGEVVTEIDGVGENKNTQFSDKINDSSKVEPFINTSGDEIIKAIHTTDIQVEPQQEKTLTEEEIKNLEDQIITIDNFRQLPGDQEVLNVPTHSDGVNKHDVSENIESRRIFDETSNSKQTDRTKNGNTITDDRKKAIDDLMSFFDNSGFENVAVSRIRRSYDHDLKVMSVAEKIHKIKKNINNAKHIYSLAQIAVDYLNEYDLEIKNRILYEVTAAEEEFESKKQFYYLQFGVILPCKDKTCKIKQISQICNGIIEIFNEEKPRVLSAFCNDEVINKKKVEEIENISVDDPLLLKLINKAVRKMELDSSTSNGLRVVKVIEANIKKLLGTGTQIKILVMVAFTSCNKKNMYIDRTTCTLLESEDPKLCDIRIQERLSFKEKQIDYTCTDVPTDSTFSDKKHVIIVNGTVNDPKVHELIQYALQRLEDRSNRLNKQKVVEIKSVTKQIISGLLTRIYMLVGYTTCSNDVEIDISSCELVNDEPLRNCEISSWERSWLKDGKQTNVTCDDEFQDEKRFYEDNANNVFVNQSQPRDLKERVKRAMPGGPIDLNPNDPQVKSLAQISLNKYLLTVGNTQQHLVLSIKKATTQIVAGSNTVIDFTAAPERHLSNIIYCHSEIWERPWLDKKDITVNCVVDDKNSRIKRDIMPGGIEELNPNDPQVKILAQESLNKYLLTVGNTEEHLVLSVKKATTQIVAGSKTVIDFTAAPERHLSNIIYCHSEIWERPWLDKKDITVNCVVDDKNSRIKRDIMPGGIEELNPNDPQVKSLAQMSLNKYLLTVGNTQQHLVLSIKKATTQIVAGSNTVIDFTAAPERDLSIILYCHSEIYDRLWLGEKDITVNCVVDDKNSRVKRPTMLGAPEELNPNDPQVKILAQESLNKYLLTVGNTEEHLVLSIKKATTQIVAGSNTVIDFTAAPERHLSNIIYCHSEIWERPWLDKKDITVNCVVDDKNSRIKRDIMPGGIEELNPNDPQVKILAQESLNKYLLTVGNTEVHLVLSVKKATTQIVAGSKTVIDFTAAPERHLSNIIYCHSEIWERPWLDKKDITVNCVVDDKNSRVKRHTMLGAPEELNPNDPQVKILAQESLNKYLLTVGNTEEHLVLSIKKATTQIVAGSKTVIDFTAAPERHLSNIIYCHSEIWERPWLDKKDITVNCVVDDKKSRIKRDIMPGGIEELNPNDPQVKILAQESLNKYLLTVGNTEVHLVLSVKKATTQIVAGSKTVIDFTAAPERHLSNIIYCHSEIWERPWLDKKDITVNCVVDDKNSRVKRHTMLGAPEELNPNDPQVKILAQESLNKYLLTVGNTEEHLVLSIKKATTQIVAGSKTVIDFTAAPERHLSNIIYCHSEIWERPWLDKKDITVNCVVDDKKSRIKRDIMPGGIEELNPNDPQVKSLAQMSLNKYLLTVGNTQQHLVLSIKKATTQIVAGSNTVIDFTAAPERDLSNIIYCHSEIWERSWLDKKDITVNCVVDDKNSRIKRDNMPGGIEELNPNDTQVKHLAQVSLNKYLLNVGNTQQHLVLSIKKATTQIVAGSNTVIDFTAAPERDLSNILYCHSEIWERPWLDKKDITVNCVVDDKNSRVKRDTMPGAPKELNPNDPQVKILAQESLNKYLLTVGNTEEHLVLSIKKATTQIVAGSKTVIDFTAAPERQLSNIIYCHSEIWERPWLDKKDITANCVVDDKNSRIKRDIMPGGIEELNPNDPQVKILAQESLNKYLLTVGNTEEHLLLNIDKATKQIVAGSKTVIDFTAVPLKHSSGIVHCHSEILEQPWLNKKEIKVNCDAVNTNSRVKRGRNLGGIREIDPNDPQVKLLAQESLSKYLFTVGNTQEYLILNIQKASKQVVAGSKTVIDFTAAPESHSYSILHCHSEIWEQPWINKKDITVNCGVDAHNSRDKRATPGGLEELNPNPKANNVFVNQSQPKDLKERVKRAVPGGPKDLNPNDPQVKLLSQESLNKYLLTVGNTQAHLILSIEKVTKQVVAGSKIEIDFTAAPKRQLSNILHCHSEIWEQLWLHKKDIKVHCDAVDTNSKVQRDGVLGGISENYLDIRENVNWDRIKRRIEPEDDYVDEDTKYYYADRAIQYVNDKSDTNNLQKVISIQSFDTSVNMGVNMVRMYIEIAYTYCMRHQDEDKLAECEELSGMYHKLCYVRLWPSSEDELVIQSISVICDDEKDFRKVTGISLVSLIKASIKKLESSPEVKYKLVHQGELHLIASLDSQVPMKLNFVVVTTNCTKDVNLNENPFSCYIDNSREPETCASYIWMSQSTKKIKKINVECYVPELPRKRRALDSQNRTKDDDNIQYLIKESLDKLELTSLHKYKQRVLQINNYNTKITTAKITTIDFDVGFTSCLKYEWVDNVTKCDFLDHLPRRHCISYVTERLWIENGRQIDVNCEDDDTPIEAHIEFESAHNAEQLANEALKYIEAKYPNPKKQGIVRIFSLEKQEVAGLHYRMKIEVGYTDCLALSITNDCKLVNNSGMNKFCRVNVWIRPWTGHAPIFRVTCDYQDGATAEMYHNIQAQHLFSDFLTTYRPNYIDDHQELLKRFEIFKTNVRKIHELNIHEQGTARYAVTRFTDLTYEEFKEKFLGLNTQLRNANHIPMRKADIPQISLPDSYDWRHYNAVTEVKNQGSCGSCWAFSVTGNIEGQWKLHSGNLVSLSEQELVDCDKLDEGCNGGLPDNAYRAIEQLGGIEMENDYPYEGTDDKCAFNKTLARVKISGAVNITSNETDMAKWLVKNGPISIGINANAMQFYVGGVSHPWKLLCDPTNLDHGVLIVGFGAKDYPLFHRHMPYWIVKNSWGPSWGEEGYYRVYRGDGTCGLNKMASSAVI